MIPLSDADAPRRKPDPVNKAIIGLNLLVFVYELTLGGIGLLFGADSMGLTLFFLTWGFIPRELTEGIAYQTFLSFGDIATPLPTWSTIFTAMFIHGGLLHLAGNLMFLWVFGSNIEARLGHVKYLLFYLAAGVAATLAHWLIDPVSPVPLVGASGAIAGVMGAYSLLYPRNRINTIIIFFFITVLRISAVWLLGFWFLLQLAQGLLSIGISGQVSVAFWAHVGGFVAGMALMAGYQLCTGQPLRPGRPRNSGFNFGPGSGPGSDRGSAGGPKYWRGRRID